MPVVNDKGYFNFDDAPGDDQSLDAIFASDELGTPAVAAPAATTESPADTTQVDSQPFLKTPTGTVYKTADEAVAGVAHKDEIIAQLRQQLLQTTNVDPITKKPSTVEDPQLTTYLNAPQQYFADLKKATTEAEVLNVQAKFFNEQLAPYAPILATVVKSQAVDKVASEVPQFRDFLGSQTYQETLNSFPLLKESIQISEAYPERSGDLAQLYRMAFDASVGRNVPKVVQGVSSTPVQTRPTVTSTPATPPPVTSNVAPPSFGTPAGRKTIMEQQEARGVENLRF